MKTVILDGFAVNPGDLDWSFLSEFGEYVVYDRSLPEEVAERIGDKATVISVDIDKEMELATKYRIQSVPTLIIYKNGKQLWRQSGIISANALTKLLKDYQ